MATLHTRKEGLRGVDIPTRVPHLNIDTLCSAAELTVVSGCNERLVHMEGVNDEKNAETAEYGP
jgi:hypothetical protein